MAIEAKNRGFFFLSFLHWQHITVHNEVATSVKHRLLYQFGSFTLLTTAFYCNSPEIHPHTWQVLNHRPPLSEHFLQALSLMTA